MPRLKILARDWPSPNHLGTSYATTKISQHRRNSQQLLRLLWKLDGKSCWCKSRIRKKGYTNFLRLLSVTTHSTSSSRQLVQGAPLSTTSHRTFRARQQQQAFDALLLTGREAAGRPAAADFRLFCAGGACASGVSTAAIVFQLGSKDIEG